MKIGILYICTGKYEKFFDTFFESSEKFFLKNNEKHYFVFTDSKRLREKFSQNSRIHFINCSHISWPLDTLLRFHFFLSIREKLEKMDFLVFFNSNVEFLTEIFDAEFLPNGTTQKLLACEHIWFLGRPSWYKKFERNKKSTAYIPYWKSAKYFYGGLNGGFTADFLGLCEACRDNIDRDFSKNFIARWHDESHLNYFFNQKENFEKIKILSPEYLFPVGFEKKFEKRFLPKIILRDKKIFQNNGLRDIGE